LAGKLGFKKHFLIEILEQECSVFLLSESENFVLKGLIYTELAPLLDGTKDEEEIVDTLMDTLSPAETYYCLRRMKDKGYITEEETQTSWRERAYWHQLGLTNADETLINTTVYIQNFSPVKNSVLIDAIKALGMNVEEGEGDVRENTIILVMADDYLLPSLSEINRKALQNNQSWMLVKPVGAVIWTGPLFIPGHTGCYECLSERLRTKRDIDLFIQTKKDLKDPLIKARGALTSTMEISSWFTAQQIALWAMRKTDAPLAGKVMSFNTVTLKSEEHILVKRPQCKLCGNGIRSLKCEPLTLKRRKKNFITGSGHRTMSAEDTFNKYAHHISSVTGVVDNLIEGCREDIIYIYFAGHNSAMKHHSAAMLEKHLRSLSAGKGTTDIQAKTGALCEAIERYCGLFQGDEPVKTAPFNKIKDKAILPNDCMNYSDNQYKNRDFINKNAHHFQIVPEIFDEEATVEWSPVWSLTKEEYRYIITSYCYYGYHDPKGYFFAWPNSNGCASGNTLEEAILQACFEIVERDAVAIWWYNKLDMPGVNLESFNIPYIEQLREVYERKKRIFWVLDITSDTDIPTFVAVSKRIEDGPEEIVFAFGSHFDPSVAIIRAITEMNQFMPQMLHDRPGEYTYKDKFAISWWKTATIMDNPYLEPRKTEEKKFSDYKNISSEDLLTDIKICQKIFEELGLELLVMDQTRKDIGLNVVKVIVPGMRHMWQRLGPGRLYDVPVKMGWLKEAKKEEELNHLAIFV